MTTKTSTHATATLNENDPYSVFGRKWSLWITGPVYKSYGDTGAYVGLVDGDQIDAAMLKADAKVEAFIADDTLMTARTIYLKDVL